MCPSPTGSSSSSPLPCKVDSGRHRYPYCIVWTPIPLITWLLPFIGHTGIGTSSGVIRDFAGPYYVSEDDMAFGWPTRYLVLDPSKARGGPSGWDSGVSKASEVYGGRMHNLFCDNCHSHVATALDTMEYDGKKNWNMVDVAARMLFCGRFVSFGGFVKTWLPFLAMVSIVVVIVVSSTVGF